MREGGGAWAGLGSDGREESDGVLVPFVVPECPGLVMNDVE